MIGPRKQKMPDKNICIGCDVLISREMGGTAKFPEKWTVFYCSHAGLPFDGIEVALISRKCKPWTPNWCPALGRNHILGYLRKYIRERSL